MWYQLLHHSKISIIVIGFILLYMCAVPPTLMAEVSLTAAPSTVVVGSSVTLTCTPTLSDNASLYNGANVNFLYRHSGSSGTIDFRNKVIMDGTVPTDSTQMTIDTSSAGTYTCTVTISEGDILHVIGSGKIGQNTTQITAQSKHLFVSITMKLVNMQCLSFDFSHKLLLKITLHINFIICCFKMIGVHYNCLIRTGYENIAVSVLLCKALH